jgi:hypothetical protein
VSPSSEPRSVAAEPAAGSIAALAQATWTHVVGAVVVMGGWAGFANRLHGPTAALRAGLTQAAVSALVTFMLKTALEAMTRRLRGAAAFVVPPLVTCGVVLTLLVTAHRLAGTRELWPTIAIPYAASSAYAWIYVFILVRRRAADSSE